MNLVLPLPGQDITQWVREKLKGLADAIYNVDVFCESDVPEYQQAECGIESGGLIAVGLILPSIVTGANDAAKIANLEDEQWWSDGAGSSPQTHWYILDTRGSKAADTFTEEEGFGLNSTEVTGADEAWVWESLNVGDNRDFVAGVNKRRKWNAVFVTAALSGSGYLAWYRENVNFRGSLLIEQNIKSRQRWSWESRASHDTTPPLPFEAPASIFVGA